MIGVLFPNEFLVSVNNSCPIWKPKKLLGATGLIRGLTTVTLYGLCIAVLFPDFQRKVGSFLCIFFL